MFHIIQIIITMFFIGILLSSIRFILSLLSIQFNQKLEGIIGIILFVLLVFTPSGDTLMYDLMKFIIETLWKI